MNTDKGAREAGETITHVVEAGGAINVSFRIFPDHVEVDVLRSGPRRSAGAGQGALTSLPESGDPVAPAPAAAGPQLRASFADWMAGVLRREGMTFESAARQLGVSVKTVSRWVGGTTEPRLRELRRIHEVFGEVPLG